VGERVGRGEAGSVEVGDGYKRGRKMGRSRREGGGEGERKREEERKGVQWAWPFARIIIPEGGCPGTASPGRRGSLILL